MNDLPKLYFTLESYLFPMLEEEIGELTDCRTGKTFPFHHQHTTLVRIGTSDERP